MVPTHPIIVSPRILNKFASQSDKLFNLGILRSDSFTGDIGEFIASKFYNLLLKSKSTKEIDAIDSSNLTYQIKSTTGSSIRLSNKSYDYLVCIYFDDLYNTQSIIKIASKDIIKDTFSVNNKFLSNTKHTREKIGNLNINNDLLLEIKKFGKIYNELIQKKIVKSKRIVGDLGEFYASNKLNLTLNINNSEKGYDAVDKNGETYEIKTRRVYDSDRRKSNTRRVRILGKTAKWLIVVTLDKSFKCNGMWKMLMKNVHNPKSAHLGVVKTTKDVEIIINTEIEWLKK
tara:strand:+ start:321 stop:1181 length:861 start_codon:yes stop_codon:yes gene_type:complete